MVYLLKMVIFHGYVSHNQMVRCIKQLLNGVYVAQVATVTGLATAAFAFRKNAGLSDFKPQTVGTSGNTM